jgi:hypothetical protein
MVPPPKRRSRTGLIALLVLIGLVAAILGGLWLFRDRISGDVGGLQVGDCIDEPSSTSSITDVQHQPCTEPHDGEVFGLVNHTAPAGATYPPSKQFEDLVDHECVPLLEAYTGRKVSEILAAGLTYAWFYPTQRSWTDSNDRGVTCYVAKDDNSKMVGSVRAGAPAKT